MWTELQTVIKQQCSLAGMPFQLLNLAVTAAADDDVCPRLASD